MKPSNVQDSRRAFLKVATSSSVATALAVLAFGCGFGRIDVETVAKRMIEALNHPHRAREIGAAYIARTPGLETQSYEILTRNLLATLSIELDEISHDTLDSLAMQLHDKVRQDFLDENVVIVEGFMLSRTEAMLCSLASVYA